jgi:Tol biopolymer transport system component
VQQITHTGGNGEENRDPAWSPDGEKLVFERRSWDGRYDLYTANADGSDERHLFGHWGASYFVAGFDPDWSPDGQRIVFVRSFFGSEHPSSLCTITPSGTDWDCFARGENVTSPDFSPDGQKILYAGSPLSGGPYELRLTEVDGGVGRVIPKPDGGPGFGFSFSPNGKKVVVSLVQPLLLLPSSTR